MAELRSTVGDSFKEKLNEVMEEVGTYQGEADYIREAVRRQMKEDLEFAENLEKLKE